MISSLLQRISGSKTRLTLPTCPNCREDEKTTDHLLLSCPFVELIWQPIRRTLSIPNLAKQVTFMWNSWRSSFKGKVKKTVWDCWFTVTSWLIWKERNYRVFELQATSPPVIIQNAAALHKESTISYDGKANIALLQSCPAFSVYV